ncbi:MAG: alkaline phosphatase PhoX [Bacteroidota bacterium]
MKRLLFTAVTLIAMIGSAAAQIYFDPEVEANLITNRVQLPASPLDMQVLFIGNFDKVQHTAIYGNPAGETEAKQWHDFIGFTPDTTGQSMGWVSVNHERQETNDLIGDGGGMTVFQVARDPDTDSLIILDQTLNDGRQGKFFNVDFVNTVGETGMNCGGVISPVDGRIWTAEEWFRSPTNISDRDQSRFVIGEGTVNGQLAPVGFDGFDGDTIEKYQNYNYMVEIDPRQAVAVRKQYNWGRQPFEGGAVMPDNKTVYLGADATPGYFTKFEADVAGDFTKGKTYVYSHVAPTKWIEIDNTDLDKMLNFGSEAAAVGATMFNRIEWVAYTASDNSVYFTETGRDRPGSRFLRWDTLGAEIAPHHIARATAQGADSVTSGDYWDYYGRIMKYDPSTNEVSVHLEGGPFIEDSVAWGLGDYPDKHLSNPDGLSSITVLPGTPRERQYLVICEDLNGTSYGRMPKPLTNRGCELFLLDMTIQNPTLDDLIRITTTPFGAEVTGAVGTPDGKTLLVNSQHPSSSNPFPFNNSLTFAITGFDRFATSLEENQFEEGASFSIYPNPVARMLYMNKVTDVAIFTLDGKRVKTASNTDHIDVQDLASGVYVIKNIEGEAMKLIIE